MATKIELLAEARKLGITGLSDEDNYDTVAKAVREAKAADTPPEPPPATAPAGPTSIDPADQPTTDTAAGTAIAGGAVASPEANQALEHSDSGTTTRADLLDAGVPMLQGDPSEAVGPEDAFGQGPKRGEYDQRVNGGPHLQSLPVQGGGEPIWRWVNPDGTDAKEGDKGATRIIVDYAPRAALADQTAAAGDVGEVAGAKGGVTT